MKEISLQNDCGEKSFYGSFVIAQKDSRLLTFYFATN